MEPRLPGPILPYRSPANRKRDAAGRYLLARRCLSVASLLVAGERSPLGFASTRGGYYHYYYFDEFTIHTALPRSLYILSY